MHVLLLFTGSLDSGVIPVNISLICSDKVTATVQADETTPAPKVLELAIKKAGKAVDTANMCVDAVIRHAVACDNAEVLVADTRLCASTLRRRRCG